MQMQYLYNPFSRFSLYSLYSRFRPYLRSPLHP
jgi:hypothetical protein